MQDVTGPVNLGNPVEFTIGDIADKITELTGSRSKIVNHPLPEDDPKQRQASPGVSSVGDLLLISKMGCRRRSPISKGC